MIGPQKEPSNEPRIVVSDERRQRLTEFGFPSVFLDAIDCATADPIMSKVVASNGEVLAEIRDLAGVAGALPPGDLVPVCHKYESDLVYYLLINDDNRDRLVHWHPEATEECADGALGFITDLVIDAFEECVAEEPLALWAERIGHPAGARLVQELFAMIGTDRHRYTDGWRAEFLASCPETRSG